MKCSVCEKKLEQIDGNDICLDCIIQELKFSEKEHKISDISEKLGVRPLFIHEFLSKAIIDRKLTGKIKDGSYLSQTYLKNLYLEKLKDFPLEHTDILEEELNRQNRLRKLETKDLSLSKVKKRSDTKKRIS